MSRDPMFKKSWRLIVRHHSRFAPRPNGPFQPFDRRSLVETQISVFMRRFSSDGNVVMSWFFNTVRSSQVSHSQSFLLLLDMRNLELVPWASWQISCGCRLVSDGFGEPCEEFKTAKSKPQGQQRATPKLHGCIKTPGAEGRDGQKPRKATKGRLNPKPKNGQTWRHVQKERSRETNGWAQKTEGWGAFWSIDSSHPSPLR